MKYKGSNPARRDKGIGLPLVVLTMTVLSIVVWSMMFFSGSQTRSLKRQNDLIRARANALAGLHAASWRLRHSRWYGEPPNNSSFGYMTETDIPGLAGTDVRFFVMASDSCIVHEYKYYVKHVDLYSRGEFNGARYVVYGRFIISPPAEYYETGSTDGVIFTEDGTEPAGRTFKRLVRITEFPGDQYLAFEDPDNGPAIRAEMMNKFSEFSDSFVNNYARINWKARADPPSGDHLSDGQAAAFLTNFVTSNPPLHPGNVFVHDRLFDMVFEGTDPLQYAQADNQRVIYLQLDPPSPHPLGGTMKDFLHAVSDQIGGVTWPDPDPETTRRETFDVEEAMKDLHDFAEADPGDPDYFNLVCEQTPAQVAYEVSWGMVRNPLMIPLDPPDPDNPDAMMQAPKPPGTVEYYGKWVSGISVSGPDPITKYHYITDPASGTGAGRMWDVVNFFEQYYTDAGATPPEEFVKSQWASTPPPTGGGGGGGGPGGSASGGW